MKQIKWKGVIVIVAALVIVIVFSGCDDLLGNDDDDEKDGNLTVSVSGFNESCANDDKPYFLGFVLPAGSDPNTTEPIAIAWEENIGSTGSGIAEIAGDDGPTGVQWTGAGGATYDVYPTVYCATDLTNLGDSLDSPAWVYKAADYSQPITYTQDGNITIETAFSDYVDGPGAPQ